MAAGGTHDGHISAASILAWLSPPLPATSKSREVETTSIHGFSLTARIVLWPVWGGGGERIDRSTPIVFSALLQHAKQHQSDEKKKVLGY